MKKFIYAALAFAPTLALAQNLGQADTLVTNVLNLLNRIIPVLFAAAIIFFFYGLVRYISKVSSDPKTAGEGKTIMIWGIIALVVMVSVYGLINWVANTAGINNNTVPQLPTIPTR